MWWDIIKNQALRNTSLGASMDWENPEIIEDDDDCKMWLKGLCDILGGNLVNLEYEFSTINLEKMPENVACAIKEYYTRPVFSYDEISTNSGEQIEPFLEEYDYDRKQFDIIIDTYFTDNISVFLSVRDINGNDIVTVGKEAIEYWKIFGDEEEKGIEELFDGKHEITKQLCSFVKKYFEYIGQSYLKEQFLDEYAWRWFMVGDERNKIKNPSQSQYKEAIRKYFW